MHAMIFYEKLWFMYTAMMLKLCIGNKVWKFVTMEIFYYGIYVISHNFHLIE